MLRDTLAALVRPVVEGLGYELWDLEYAAGRGDGLVRAYIDATAGVTVDVCERVSRAVSARPVINRRRLRLRRLRLRRTRARSTRRTPPRRRATPTRGTRT